MALKTREKLIDVARQLFARKGLENTTMSDIATASDKGRRTIYTYFKNKREIYNAVVERDAEQLVSRLRRVVDDASLTPTECLRRYLLERIDLVTEAVNPREGSLLTRITRDMRRVERIRRIAVAKEAELLRAVLTRGVESGEFDKAQTERFLTVQAIFFQGVDYSHMRNNFADLGIEAAQVRQSTVDFVVDAVTVKHT